MANIGLPWSVSTSGYTIQPVNGEFSAWSQGVNVPPDGWTVVSGKWASDMAQCQGTLGPYAVDFGSVSGVGCITSEDIAILPATKYLLSAYYRISSGSGSASSQGVRIDWYDESRTLLQSTNLDLTANTAGVWTAGGLEVTSPNGAVYARVLCGRFNVQGSTDFQLDSVKFDRKVYIPAGTVSMDDVADGPLTYARPLAAHMDAGRIKEVLRGAGVVATDYLFKKPNTTDPDTLDAVPNGTLYSRLNASAVSSGNPKTDSLVDGAYSKVAAGYVDATSKAITNIWNGAGSVSGSVLFNKSADNLSNILDGGGFAKVNSTAVSGGNPKTDSLVDGSYSKVAAGYVDATTKAITTIRNTALGVDIAGSAVFRKATDTLDDVAEGTTYKRLLAGAVTSGYPSSVWRDGASLATSSLFKKGSDTFSSVAGTLSDGQLGSNVVNTANIKDGQVTTLKVADGNITTGKVASSAITSSKTDFGVPFSAYDEAVGSSVFSRVTLATNCTFENGGSRRYSTANVTTAQTDPVLSTDISTQTTTNQITTHALLVYRLRGGFIGSSVQLAFVNPATSQTAYAPVVADGAWHAAAADISDFASASTLAVGVDTNTLSTAGQWDIAYLGAGTLGASNYALTSKQGNVGVGTASPGDKLSVVGGGISSSSTGNAYVSLDAGTGGAAGSQASYIDFKLNGVLKGNLAVNEATSGTPLEINSAVTSNVTLVTGGGSVGIGTTSPSTKLDVNGSTTLRGDITFSSNAGGARIINKASADRLELGAGSGEWSGVHLAPQPTISVSGVNQFPRTSNYWNFNNSGVNPTVLEYRSLVMNLGSTNPHYFIGLGGGTGRFGVFTANTERLTVLTGGNVGVGAASPEEKLEVRTASNAYGVLHSDGTTKVGTYVGTNGGEVGTKSNHDFRFFTNGAARALFQAAGAFVPAADNTYTLGVSATRWKEIWCNQASINSTSDERQKTDIETSDLGLDFIEALRPVRYRWKVGQSILEQVPDGEDEEGNPKFREVLTPVPGKRPHYGFLAQHVAAILGSRDFAGFIHDEETDMYGLRYSEFIAPLVKAVQELSVRLKQLEARLPTNQA